MAIAQDPFDSLLSLEDDFYREGFDLGVSDGERAGLIEGRAFGLEKGFERYITMGPLYGRAMIWAGRLPGQKVEHGAIGGIMTKETAATSDFDTPSEEKDGTGLHVIVGRAPGLPINVRLEAHIRTLYALAEPGSLSTTNDEDSVSEFDDRLRRAEGKVKVIEKLTGEYSFDYRNPTTISDRPEKLSSDKPNQKGDGSIEDISSLHARH